MRIGQTELSLKRGDITEEIVDVIVNAANSGLAGGGGVDGAIHRAGGPSILEECRAIVASRGRCPAGDAVLTGAGKLQAKHIIHTVGPIWRGGQAGEQETLRRAYLSSLALASRAGAQTIAFPSISTGAYGYPIREAAETALRACADFAEQEQTLFEIRFILFSSNDLLIYREQLESLDAGEEKR